MELLVKQIREKKGITRYRLAKMTGISTATLQSMENAAEPNPTFRHLCAIADALGVTLNDLRGGDNDVQR